MGQTWGRKPRRANCSISRASRLDVSHYRRAQPGAGWNCTDMTGFDWPSQDPAEDQDLAALVAEFKRVAPNAPEDMLLGSPPSLAEALAAIRRLPDGAGLVAIARAWGYPDATIQALEKELGA